MKTKKTITIEQAIKAGNDGKNQDIKSKFVGREVFCNVNTLAEYVLKKGFEDSEAPFTLDDIENYYSYPEYKGEYADFEGGTEEQRDSEVERLKELRDSTTDLQDNPEKIDSEIEDLENLETEPADIFEWWAVTGWFAEKLKEKGQCVVDAGSCHIWGRQTTGQAILLDHVITLICADMGILEGQENEWSV